MYAIGGVIYVGGTSTTTNSVDIYDPILDSWSSGIPLPEPRASFAIAVHDGKIFVFGGTPAWGTGIGTDSTFIFDPVQNSWSTGDSMPTSRRANEAAVIGNIIFVIGGAGNPGAGTTNEAYGDFPYEPVVASFSASPTSGVSPLLVSFTNQSSGDYDTCLWDLGDSNTSADCDLASHQYLAPGVYTVTLKVSGFGGTDTLIRTNYIAIYEPAVASFSASPTSGVSTLLVSFTNQSNGDYDTCLWDLGDSNTSADCDLASYVYTDPGEYSVALTVSGSGGTDKITRAGYIEVQDHRFLYLPVVLKTEA
jgi:PKD repeat protein